MAISAPSWGSQHLEAALPSSLQDGADFESTPLWMMARRTGLPLIDDKFDPLPLRRKEAVPIITFAEMFGME